MRKRRLLPLLLIVLLLLILSGCSNSNLQRIRGLVGDGKIITRDFKINESEYFQEVQKGRTKHSAIMLQELNKRAEEIREENKVEHSSETVHEDGTTSTDTWYEYPDVEVIFPVPPTAPAMSYLQMVDENILRINKYMFNEESILDFYNTICGEILVEGGGMSFTVRVDYLPIAGEDYTAEEEEPSMVATFFPLGTTEYISNRGYFIDSTNAYEAFLSDAGYSDGNDSGYSPGGDNDFSGNIAFDQSLTGKICAWATSKVGLGYSQGEAYHASRRKQCAYCISHPGTSAGRYGATHYDCSGLVYCAYKAYGLDVSWNGATTAAEEARGLEARGCQVGYTELAAGDLVFFSTSRNGRYKDITHVAIYIGNNQIVHARSTKTGVRIDSLDIYSKSSIRSMVRPSGLSR